MTYPFPRNVYSPVMWPFTLDFSYTLVCNIQPCPKKTYPGYWIIPVVVMMDYREHLPCAYVDHCTNEPRNHDETFDMLWKNFLRNYRTNRAPMYVNLHSIWLETDFHLDAMDEFIKRLSAMDDVFVLPIHKALDWMRKPTPISRIKDFEPWQCDFQPNQEDNEFCSFTFRPRTTTTTARPTTTAHRHYHNTQIDDRDADDDYSAHDNDRDHNGVEREGGRSRGGGKEKESLENLEIEQRRHGREHVHRPWFLRGCAGSSPAEAFTVLLCGVLSVWVSVIWT
ncbi:chitin deacetylase 8-like isoform X2 [Littorina saxatilis]